VAVSWRVAIGVLILYGAAISVKEHSVALVAVLLLTDYFWNPGFALTGIRKNWRPLDDISPALIRAVIASEDQRFCRHFGFDWSAIEMAWEQYQSGDGGLLGASTISMQTAKNVFLWPARNWLRKALEAYFTALIELAWSKRRIIEVYLNVVEWGPGIYGAEAAAEHYFHKPAARLNATEAARLAAVLPDPLDRSASRPDEDVLERSAFALREMPRLPAPSPLPCGQKL